jgi:hypothetical protein
MKANNEIADFLGNRMGEKDYPPILVNSAKIFLSNTGFCKLVVFPKYIFLEGYHVGPKNHYSLAG